MMVTRSPGSSEVSSPLRSRMWWVFTKRLMCRRNVPVSSQMLRCNAGQRRSSSSSTAPRFVAASTSSDAPAQQSRSGVGMLTVTVAARAADRAGVSRGGIGPERVRFKHRRSWPENAPRVMRGWLRIGFASVVVAVNLSRFEPASKSFVVTCAAGRIVRKSSEPARCG